VTFEVLGRDGEGGGPGLADGVIAENDNVRHGERGE
jgi:hypothetical protein